MSTKPSRIVTRPDFDGVVCAVLLYEALDIQSAVKWVQPNDVQMRRVDIRPGDVIANLPYHPQCTLWFDHHYSNRIDIPFQGAFDIAPSAARVIYTYFDGRFSESLQELLVATDRIDAAELTLDEILHPENHPYVLLSMTFGGGNDREAPYWDHLVDLLRHHPVEKILEDEQVLNRCHRTLKENSAYVHHLKAHTTLDGHISITDFRELETVPEGNRFLVYSLFPESVVNVKIFHNQDKTVVKLGHSILNRGCRVNVGKLLSAYEGGGHRGAGACRFHQSKTDRYLPQILDALRQNQPNE
jgi:hypothetical protein